MPFLIGLLLVFLLCALVFGYQGARRIFIWTPILGVVLLLGWCSYEKSKEQTEAPTTVAEDTNAVVADANVTMADTNAAPDTNDTPAPQAQAVPPPVDRRPSTALGPQPPNSAAITSWSSSGAMDGPALHRGPPTADEVPF